jgi:hypothetical protein
MSLKILKASLFTVVPCLKIANSGLFAASQREMRSRQCSYNLLTLGRSALRSTIEQ